MGLEFREWNTAPRSTSKLAVNIFLKLYTSFYSCIWSIPSPVFWVFFFFSGSWGAISNYWNVTIRITFHLIVQDLTIAVRWLSKIRLLYCNIFYLLLQLLNKTRVGKITSTVLVMESRSNALVPKKTMFYFLFLSFCFLLICFFFFLSFFCAILNNLFSGW